MLGRKLWVPWARLRGATAATSFGCSGATSWRMGTEGDSKEEGAGAHSGPEEQLRSLGEATRRAWGRWQSRWVEVEEGIDGVVLRLVCSSTLVEVTSVRRRSRWTL